LIKRSIESVTTRLQDSKTARQHDRMTV